jgi:hypothetical protein
VTTAGSLAPHRPEVYRPVGQAPGVDEPGQLGRIVERFRPDEGWASLPLVMMLAGTMAWSIADARWILGQNQLTSFVVWVALAAALWGYFSARLGLPPWLAQALGCTIGAFVLIEAIGASLPDAAPGLGGWFQATAQSVTQAYLDLTWRHQTTTTHVGHFALIIGIVVWGTAQAASYDVFGYHRSVNGVLLLAVVLVANMALTQTDQFMALVVFSAAALVLLLLAHAADERSSWLAHRIWRGRDFQAPHLRGGLAFASLAVVGSLILTTVASSAPLASTLKDLGSNVQDEMSWLSGFLPNGGASRLQPNADFGATAPISSSFRESNHDIFTVRVDGGSSAFHWRLVAYDTFQTTGWSVGANSNQDQVTAGSSLGAGSLNLAGSAAPGRRQVTMVVHVQDTTIQHLIVANEPASVNTDVQRTLVGANPLSVNVASLNSGATDYIVSAYVPDLDPAGNGLTEWRLQHAGGDYPPGLLDRYLQGANLVGSDGKALLSEIGTWARQNGNAFIDEYDVAKAIQDYLRSDKFTYNTDISSLIALCTGLSTVDCFASIRTGFCEQYATTMTMLMRMDGFPARYTLGYLPGAIDPLTTVQQVTSQQKHAWVEVFFPTYGWIPFDPTGGGVGQPTALAPGGAPSETPIPSETPSPSNTAAEGRPIPSRGPAAGAGSTTTDYGPAPLLATGSVVLVLALVLFVLWRRRPRPLEEPETVYRNVVRLASRLGYKPQPTQTVFEYTGMLADVVPQARDSLGIVATATVEVNYGKRKLSSERLAFLANAQKIIRGAFLRLAFRVPGLRGRGRAPGGSATRRRGSGRSRS